MVPPPPARRRRAAGGIARRPPPPFSQQAAALPDSRGRAPLTRETPRRERVRPCAPEGTPSERHRQITICDSPLSTGEGPPAGAQQRRSARPLPRPQGCLPESAPGPPLRPPAMGRPLRTVQGRVCGRVSSAKGTHRPSFLRPSSPRPPFCPPPGPFPPEVRCSRRGGIAPHGFGPAPRGTD